MAKRVQIYKTSNEQDRDIFFNEVKQTLSEQPKRIPGKYAYGGAGT